LKYFLFIFGIFLFHLTLESHHLIAGVCFVLIAIYLFIKEKSMVKWLGIYTVSFLLLMILRHLYFQTNHSYYLVIEQRQNWAIIHNGIEAYYWRLNQVHETHWGDIVKIEGYVTPLKMTTYEGLFSFPEYLQQRGVDAMLNSMKVDIWFRFPLRVDDWIESRLLQLDFQIRPFVTQLLWKRNIDTNLLQENLLALVQYSGLGFYLTNQWLDGLLKLKLNANQSRLFRLLFFLPYVVMNLRLFGIVRVYGIEGLKLIYPKKRPTLLKVQVVAIQSWIHPFMWFQESTIVYMIYQLWSGLWLGLLPKKNPWFRGLSFVAISLLYQWFKMGIIFNFSAILFFSLSAIHSLLFPFWVFFLYTGISIPGLLLITSYWLEFLNIIAYINLAFYGGEVSVWIQVSIVFMLTLISILSWLKLSSYQPNVMLIFMMIILFQISGLKIVFLSEVSFMNVGQGDATFIYSQGKSMLIDTGGVRHFDMAKEVLIPYFKKLSIRVLDYLVITHPDFDHDGAMASLIASFPVKKVIQKPFHQINLGVYVVQNYQHFLPFLEEDNERSLVLGIQFQDCRWLIMGDATYATEALIQSQYPNLTANILRIGHHGSNTSTSSEFLNQIKPKEAVISVGGGNRYGHPHQEVLARLEALNIDIRRTDIEGTIRYQTCKI